MSETNFAAAVGKTFRIKDAEGSAAEQRFKVEALTEKFDFGPRRGGVKPAFRIVRQPHGTESTVRADLFLQGHEEMPDSETEAPAAS